MKKGSILIIDDEDELRILLRRRLSLEKYDILDTGSARQGLDILEEQTIDVVLLDVMLGNVNGIELIPRIQEIAPPAEIIMMTAFGSIEDGVRAIKSGAFDYLTKGEEENQFIPVIERALEKVRLTRKIERLEGELGKNLAFESLVGSSQALKNAVDVARRVATADTPVLLLGETGTGKEVFANAIHNASERAPHEFVAVNCSAIARELLESEMFGYKAGAFTGAKKNKQGLFEVADGGTLLLDEIGDMDLRLQAKLLRAIETQSFIKAGDTAETTVDVRIIAATNRDLTVEIEKGRFREDLFYRLGVIKIEIPPLRERRGDIPSLIRSFVTFFSKKMNRPVPEISTEFQEKLSNYDYPGNVRELRNLVERAIILSSGNCLDAATLPREFLEASSEDADSDYDARLSLAEVEKRHIRNVLDHCEGNKTRTAEVLGIGAATLYRKIKTYGL